MQTSGWTAAVDGAIGGRYRGEGGVGGSDDCRHNHSRDKEFGGCGGFSEDGSNGGCGCRMASGVVVVAVVSVVEQTLAMVMV